MEKKDLKDMFFKMYTLLPENGFIALADLDKYEVFLMTAKK